MAERTRRINAPFVFEEEGYPERISFDGARLTFHFEAMTGNTHLDVTYDAQDVDLFYANDGDRTGVRFRSAACPGTSYELRFEHEEPRVMCFFETHNGENRESIKFRVVTDRWHTFHDFVSDRVFAPAAAPNVPGPAANQDPVPAEEDPPAGGRRRTRRAGRVKRNKRSKRTRRH